MDPVTEALIAIYAVMGLAFLLFALRRKWWAAGGIALMTASVPLMKLTRPAAIFFVFCAAAACVIVEAWVYRQSKRRAPGVTATQKAPDPKP